MSSALPPSFNVSPAVAFRQVGKRYGSGPLILDNLTLSAAPGDFIALIGPSGCGKSTLLKLIAGLGSVTHGELTLAPGELAYVFQDATLLPWLTVAQNVALPLQLRSLPVTERTAKIDSALALVGLTAHASFYPRQLSGGQKMRVSIARALAFPASAAARRTFRRAR